MASILSKMFQQRQQPQQTQPNLIDQLQQIRQAGPSDAIFNQMYQSNPQFKQFADSMRGKTPEQAFSEKGFDFNNFKQYKW